MSDSVVGVSRETVEFEVKLHEAHTQSLTLTNKSKELVAFKVKTTAPDRYAVRPSTGFINPGGQHVCEIEHAALDSYPDKRKDKFLIQAVNVKDTSEVPWKDLESKQKEGGGGVFQQIKVKSKLNFAVKDLAAQRSARGRREAELLEQAAKSQSSSEPAIISDGGSVVSHGGDASNTDLQRKYQQVVDHSAQLEKDRNTFLNDKHALEEQLAEKEHRIEQLEARLGDLRDEVKSLERTNQELSKAAERESSKPASPPPQGDNTLLYILMALVIVLFAYIKAM